MGSKTTVTEISERRQYQVQSKKKTQRSNQDSVMSVCSCCHFLVCMPLIQLPSFYFPIPIILIPQHCVHVNRDQIVIHYPLNTVCLQFSCDFNIFQIILMACEVGVCRKTSQIGAIYCVFSAHSCPEVDPHWRAPETEMRVLKNILISKYYCFFVFWARLFTLTHSSRHSSNLFSCHNRQQLPRKTSDTLTVHNLTSIK